MHEIKKLFTGAVFNRECHKISVAFKIRFVKVIDEDIYFTTGVDDEKKEQIDFFLNVFNSVTAIDLRSQR